MFIDEEPMDFNIVDTLTIHDIIINQVEKTVDEVEEPMDIVVVKELTGIVNDDDHHHSDERYNNIKLFLHNCFDDWKNGDMTTNILKICRGIIKEGKLSLIDISAWNRTA